MAGASFVSTAGPHLVEPIQHAAGFPRDRIVPSLMGIDTEAFRNEDRRPPPVVGRLRLATVARLHHCKGHKHALAAMRALVDRGYDLTYTIAGEGPHRGAIEGVARDLHLLERVTFVGSLGEREVLDLLREVDAFVLPSVGIGEAAPVSVMEAMACGLPVVCSIIGSTAAMVRDGVEGYLVPQGDEAGLASALATLADEPGLARPHGSAAARRRQVASFDRSA